MTLAERLATQFEQRICRVCVHETAEGGCALASDRKCPVFEWSQKLAELFADVHSDQLSDYLDQVQAIVCPDCLQDEKGHCEEREHLNCPLDLYLGIVVEILEEELSACRDKRD